MKSALLALLLFLMVACASTPTHRVTAAESKLATVELVKASDGQTDKALEYYKRGWLRARVVAKERGVINDYKLHINPQGGEWDILLITEYRDKEQFEASESQFQSILAEVIPGPIVIDGKPGRDYRNIISSHSTIILEK